MFNLLLPAWFNPWGWVVVGVAAIIILVCILILVLKSGKKSEAEEKPVKAKKSAEKKTEAKTEKEPAEKKSEEKSANNANKTYHISKRKDDNKWQVKAAGGNKALKLFNTQAEAIEYAKETAKNQDARIVIHKEDGSFRRLTY